MHILVDKFSLARAHMEPAMQKRLPAHADSAKGSGPLLSAIKRIIGYYRMYEWRAKARAVLCAWAGCTFCACLKAVANMLSYFLSGLSKLGRFFCGSFFFFFF